MGWQVRRVVDVGPDHAVVVLHGEDGTTASVWAVRAPSAAHRLTPDARFHDLAVPLGPTDGVSDAWAAGDLAVVRTVTLSEDRARYRLFRFAADPAQPATAAGASPWSVRELGEVSSHGETPLVTARPTLLRAGLRQLHTAVLLPPGGEHAPPGSLPVLLDPYGGPHHQEVLAARRIYAEPQWLADQGFAVVVIDGRGTPGKGPAWERAVHLDFAGPVLEDQIDGLHAVAALYPQLDLGRVAIRGWSFGGYLAALAVLRRPDVFHAAVAGAPVTDWALYDTGYTERYLGDPTADAAAYARSSLLADAPSLRRPLLLILGRAAANVVAAPTRRLSSALLAAGRPHAVLPLSGVTHMTSQEVVAENLLLLQVDFLKRALADPAP
jgi:dipeptidyl-peptidase-4